MSYRPNRAWIGRRRAPWSARPTFPSTPRTWAGKAHFGVQYTIQTYEQHALSSGSGAAAISYVGIESGELYWGAGEDTDITLASVRALTAALNNYFNK